jgi:hypothetical protein
VIYVFTCLQITTFSSLTAATHKKFSFYLDSISYISSLHMHEFFRSELSSALRCFEHFAYYMHVADYPE